MPSPTVRTTALFAVGALALTGCGASTLDNAADGGDTPPVAGMCAPEHPDCVDTVVAPDDDEPAGNDEFPSEQVRADAELLLGTPEDQLPDEVRVGRRGDESFMLTEDYVLGRMTVELDEVDRAYVVTKVTVELPEGPVTFES